METLLLAQNMPFREFSLDGAVLYFDPRTGTSVRAQSPQTAGRVRTAPRVVMFGITNACNLRCEFCSRDPRRASLWTEESARAVLAELAAAGTLEVAFGGGEPFAFRGFAALLGELRRTTRLALHVTTNGTLLSPSLLAELAGVIGQVRLSIYDDIDWRKAAAMLAGAGQLFGANVLVSDAQLPKLPALLAELAQLSCHDVSLLNYVGPDTRLHLSAAGEQRLARIIAESPLPARLSVCFGHRLSVPRLFDGADNSGDCGAGYDFVSITPDQRMQSCSFQDASLPAETAAQILTAWRAQAALLRRPSSRLGCARKELRAGRRPAATDSQLAVWQAFSGNNSGECFLVARFESTEAADAYIAELVPGYSPGDTYGAPWKELFQRERVDAPGLAYGEMPDSMVAIRRTVVARGYAADDAFPELRTLAWKRGADVLPGGIHVHEGTTALFAARCRDQTDAAALVAQPPHSKARTYAHGDYALGVLLLKDARDDPGVHSRGYGPAHDTSATAINNVTRLVAEWAGERPLSFELYFDAIEEAELVQAKQRLGEPPQSESRGVAWFFGSESQAKAQRLARTLSEDATVIQAASTILMEGLKRPKRLAVLSLRSGAVFEHQHGREAVVTAHLVPMESEAGRARRAPPKQVDMDAVARDLPPLLYTALSPKTFSLKGVDPTWGGRAMVGLVTEAPALALPVLDAYAKQQGYRLFVAVEEHRPLRLALQRLLATCTRG